MKKKYIVALTSVEREVLEKLTTTGKAAAYKINHARILLKADTNQVDGGWTDEKINIALDKNTLDVKIDGVISDGQQSIRKAVEVALPGIAHGLCHFHYLKEAAKVIYEADRHAKKELKKQVRGIRQIERQ